MKIMDSRLDDAHETGVLVTSNDSNPVSNRDRMMSYYARRDKFARLAGEPELGVDAYDRRMAAKRSSVQQRPNNGVTQTTQKQRVSDNSYPIHVTQPTNNTGYQADRKPSYVNSIHMKRRPSRWV